MSLFKGILARPPAFITVVDVLRKSVKTIQGASVLADLLVSFVAVRDESP